jgi:uncharacterized membrane protein
MNIAAVGKHSQEDRVNRRPGQAFWRRPREPILRFGILPTDIAVRHHDSKAMTTRRRIVLDWAEQGQFPAPDILRALAVAEVLPSLRGWQRFLDQLLLWMGVLLFAAGLIFFLAFNWNEIDRLSKFALAEALVAVTLAFVWWLGLERPSGKAALVGASLFVGGLFALIGQTYQTGADSFELFGTWAVMILPWALVGRFDVLWLLWLLVANVAIAAYFQTFPGRFLLFSGDQALWGMFCVDTAALAVWEVASRRGVEWLRSRWAPRLIATASGTLVTVVAITAIFDEQDGGILAIGAWLAWLASAWIVYRRLVKDLYVLAGGVLSTVLVVAAFLANVLFRSSGGTFQGFLLIGVVVIGLSAAGGMWLRRVAIEAEA